MPEIAKLANWVSCYQSTAMSVLYYRNTYLVIGRYELVNCLAQHPYSAVLQVMWSRLVVMWHEYGSQEWESEAVRGTGNGGGWGLVFLHQREQSRQRGDRKEGGGRGKDPEGCFWKQLPCWNKTHHSILLCSHSHCNAISYAKTANQILPAELYVSIESTCTCTCYTCSVHVVSEVYFDVAVKLQTTTDSNRMVQLAEGNKHLLQHLVGMLRQDALSLSSCWTKITSPLSSTHPTEKSL